MIFGFGRRRMRPEEVNVEVAREISAPARGLKTGAHRAGTSAIPAGEVDDGVYVNPTPITAGSKVTVRYNGLLSRSGADAVYLHAGFGVKDWRDVRDIPMTKDPEGMWVTTIPIDVGETSRFNFCFRDSAHNWDNNNGRNWSYEIHAGKNIL